MPTAVGAVHEVMNLQCTRRAATGHATAATIAAPDEAHGARRNILMSALRAIAVE